LHCIFLILRHLKQSATERIRGKKN